MAREGYITAEDGTEVMSTQRAFLIVYELAQENALEERKCDEELVEAARDQQEALNVVHDYLTNHIYD